MARVAKFPTNENGRVTQMACVQSKAKGLEMFPSRIKDEHFWRGADDVYVEFVALFDLYHQDALHKCLMSVWCM